MALLKTHIQHKITIMLRIILNCSIEKIYWQIVHLQYLTDEPIAAQILLLVSTKTYFCPKYVLKLLKIQIFLFMNRIFVIIDTVLELP